MWTRYELGKCEEPSYVVPFENGKLSFSTHECSCLVRMPYRSVPVWPKEADGERPIFYSYYFCGKCARPVTHIKAESYQVAFKASFLEKESILCWCIVLLCLECCPPLVDASHLPIILICTTKIEPLIENAVVGVNLNPKRKLCHVCGIKLKRRLHPPVCDNDDCRAIYPQLDHTPDGPFEKLMKVFNRFKDTSLDIVSCVRWGICHRADGTCLKLGNAELSCKKCRRVEYCSKRCMRESHEQHVKHCTSFVHMWSLENIILC